MASRQEFVEFACEQISGNFEIDFRKMFGEYMVYINKKPALLICDDTVYVKKLPEVEGLLGDSECGIPYKGAKEHYILDIENRELACQVAAILERVLPMPKPKKKKPKV